MRAINGIHASTVGMAWNLNDMFSIMAPQGPYTMLDPLLTDIENGRWWPMLRSRFGAEPLIHIRMYSEAGWPNPNYRPHWNEVDPATWASECRRRLSAIPGLLQDPNVILSFNNEPDLAGEGHPQAGDVGHNNVPIEVYQEIWNWYASTVKIWKELAPDAKCAVMTPPLATGHEPENRPPDWEYTMPEFAALVKLCDVLGGHAYFLPDGTGATEAEDGYWRGIRCLRPKGYREIVQGKPPVGGFPDPGGLCSQYPHKPFLVAEFGNFAHDLADTASVSRTMAGYHACYKAYSDSGRCLGVTPFLWNSGPEHKQNRIRGNVGLTVRLQAMTRYPACEWPYKDGGNMPTKPVFLFGFKALADKLGADVVGEPIEDQWAEIINPLGMAPVKIVKQRTTTGYMQTEEVPANSGNWRSPQFFDDVGSRPKVEGPAKGVII